MSDSNSDFRHKKIVLENLTDRTPGKKLQLLEKSA